MAAVLESVAGRMVEQLAGSPHLSDEALFWTLVAIVTSLARPSNEPLQGEANTRRNQDYFANHQATTPKTRASLW